MKKNANVKRKASRYESYYSDFHKEADAEVEETGGFELRDVLRFFAVDIIIVMALRLILWAGGFTSLDSYVTTILISKLVLLGYLFWLIRLRGEAWQHTGIATAGRWWAWPAALVFYAGCYFALDWFAPVNQAIVAKAHEILRLQYVPQPQEVLFLIMSDVINTPARVLLIIFTVLIGPFMEELAFRGMGLDAFWRRYGTFAAAIWTSILFSLYHFSLVFFLPLLLLGLIFALVRIYSRSLWCSVFVHCLHNAVTLAVLAYHAGVLDPRKFAWLFGYLGLEGFGASPGLDGGTN